MARIDDLAEGWLAADLSDEEVREFLALLHSEGDALPELIAAWLADPAFAVRPDAQGEERMFRAILRQGQAAMDAGPQPLAVDMPPPPARPRWLRRLAVAAAALLAIAAAWLLWQPAGPRGGGGATVATTNKRADLPPGGNKAVLTLGNGSRIVLDSAANGLLAQQGATQVKKTANGRLAYTQGVGGAHPPGAGGRETKDDGAAPQGTSHQGAGETYNTLTTPRGGQYQLTLPDGTHVWLDAASSITYHTAFTGPDRRVTMTGQAYFEVAHKASQPFRVVTGNTVLEDLGTAFNVNAYAEEPAARYTLLEGGIAVKAHDRSMTLRPGQQAELGPSGLRLRTGVDTAAVLAWKNGRFLLKGIDFGALMRQVGRWYDVDVVYAGAVPERQFGGAISRGVPLSTVLAALQRYGIPCQLDNKTIIIGKP